MIMIISITCSRDCYLLGSTCVINTGWCMYQHSNVTYWEVHVLLTPVGVCINIAMLLIGKYMCY